MEVIVQFIVQTRKAIAFESSNYAQPKGIHQGLFGKIGPHVTKPLNLIYFEAFYYFYHV